jgi:hypothetical protein
MRSIVGSRNTEIQASRLSTLASMLRGLVISARLVTYDKVTNVLPLQLHRRGLKASMSKFRVHGKRFTLSSEDRRPYTVPIKYRYCCYIHDIESVFKVHLRKRREQITTASVTHTASRSPERCRNSP